MLVHAAKVSATEMLTAMDMVTVLHVEHVYVTHVSQVQTVPLNVVALVHVLLINVSVIAVTWEFSVNQSVITMVHVTVRQNVSVMPTGEETSVQSRVVQAMTLTVVEMVSVTLGLVNASVKLAGEVRNRKFTF